MVAAQSDPQTQPVTLIYIPTVLNQSLTCQLNQHEAAVETLLRHDSGQQRTEMNCNVTLAKVARERAKDMADRDYFGHTNPDGYGPNYLVQSAGYELPSYYGQSISANNVESIAAGHATADAVWSAWMASEKHREHLLAENDFYREQIDYGIGFAQREGAAYQYYWVVITAKSGDE
jgi:uncharacterized protein YkwD